MAKATPYKYQIEILSNLWLEQRDEEKLAELFEFADLGFPLAYAIDNGIVESTVHTEKLIQETFAALLDTLDVEDSAFETAEEMFEAAGR